MNNLNAEILMGYKGDSFMDSGYFRVIYPPLISTSSTEQDIEQAKEQLKSPKKQYRSIDDPEWGIQ